MPRTIADRIGIGIYEAAELNRARGRCLAPIVAGVSATPRPAKPQSYLAAFPGSTTRAPPPGSPPRAVPQRRRRLQPPPRARARRPRLPARSGRAAQKSY